MTWRISHPAKSALAVALLIAGYAFAPFLPHLIAAKLGYNGISAADLRTFYRAAVITRAGGNPYDLTQLSAGATSHIYPFLYPPTSLPAFLPLAFGGRNVSVFAFQLISFICLVYILFVVIRTAEEEKWPMAWCVVGLVSLASFSAISLTFQAGQVNFMATAAILFAWTTARLGDLRGGREVACAIALLIATVLKTYPVLLVILFLIRGDFRVFAWFAIFMAANALLAWLTIPHDVWRAWIVNVMPTGRFGISTFGLYPPSAGWNQSLNGALSRILGPNTTLTIGPFVQVAVFGFASVVCWIFRDCAQRGFYDLGFGAIIAATFLIAPVSWFHHYVFLIPALTAFASILARSDRRDSKIWTTSLFVITILISVCWPSITTHPHHPAIDIIGMTLPISGPLALFVMFAVLPFALRWHLASMDRLPQA
jgi:alpha-1,2-mannosyltransferase